MNLSAPTTILITCAHGLVESLSRELRSLGYETQTTHRASVTIRGSIEDAMRLNLSLRTGFAVLYLLSEFEARDPEALYRHIHDLPWEELISPDVYLSVASRVDTPSVNNSMFPSLKVKDAIVDRLNARCGSRPDSGPKRNGVVLDLYWRHDHARLYLNTSGEKLADRGYRKMPFAAPLQETLAAGILLTAGYTGERPLVVPMCGSGTLAIEAALIALNRPPGLLRSNYSLLHVEPVDHGQWRKMRSEMSRPSRKELSAPIIAGDNDPAAITAARKNAQTAGVEHLIDFETCDFAAMTIPPGEGTIILNPGYGKRMGERKKLEETYRRIGDFFKQKCAGYTGYIFTGNLEAAKCVGLKVNRRIPFYNADIECRLLKYEIYAGSRDKEAEVQQTARPSS